MKIGIVTTWFERGAAYISKQYQSILENDNEIFIYVRGGEEKAINNKNWDHSNVHWGKSYIMPVSPTYIDKKDFKNWLLRNKIDVVFFNEQNWWSSVIICKELDIKVGAHIDYYTKDTIGLFKAYDFLICNTKRHVSVFDWHKQNFYVPWGTNIDIFKFSSNENEIITFFHSCGMSPYRKGTDILINTVSKLADKYKFKLIIHSQVNIEDLFPHLRETITKLKSKGFLEVISKTVSAPGLFHLGDVYVYPSRLDGIGLTIAEAQSCGLPVITTNEPPMNEQLTFHCKTVDVKEKFKREDGYYWDLAEVDEQSLYDQMLYFINLEKDKMGELKKITRIEAEKKFDWSRRKDLVNEIFNGSKKMKLDKSTINKIYQYDNSVYPMVTNFPKFYRYLYRFYLSLKKFLK